MRALGEAPVCNISKLRPAACHSESLTEHIAILHISISEYCNITYQYIAMLHISKLPAVIHLPFMHLPLDFWYICP